MADEHDRGASKNADDKHVHTPESGKAPDDALRAGNTSGSGDVERAQREDAMTSDGGEKGVPGEPAPDGARQAKRTLERNSELLDGAEPGPEGEKKIAGIHTESSTDGRRTGDYSND
jgi:hypothetical protein